jgi:hypothetical protein
MKALDRFRKRACRTEFDEHGVMYEVLLVLAQPYKL